MAAVTLDTPAAAYGLPLMLLPPHPVFAGHDRLGPAARAPAAAVAAWWQRRRPRPLELPDRAPAHPADRVRDTWHVPSDLLTVAGGVDMRAGAALPVTTAQHGVNANHVADLADLADLLAAGVRLGAVHVLVVDGIGWLMDGVHRTCAALTVGDRTVSARVVDPQRARTCPCGWGGSSGGLLTHPCRTGS